MVLDSRCQLHPLGYSARSLKRCGRGRGRVWRWVETVGREKEGIGVLVEMGDRRSRAYPTIDRVEKRGSDS